MQHSQHEEQYSVPDSEHNNLLVDPQVYHLSQQAYSMSSSSYTQHHQPEHAWTRLEDVRPLQTNPGRQLTRPQYQQPTYTYEQLSAPLTQQSSLYPAHPSQTYSYEHAIQAQNTVSHPVQSLQERACGEWEESANPFHYPVYRSPTSHSCNSPYEYPDPQQASFFRDPTSPGVQAAMSNWVREQRERDPSYGAELSQTNGVNQVSGPYYNYETTPLHYLPVTEQDFHPGFDCTKQEQQSPNFDQSISTSPIFKLSITLNEYLAQGIGSKRIQKEHPLPAQATPRLSKEEITQLYEKAKENLALSKAPDKHDKDMYGLQAKGHKWLYNNKIRKNKFWGQNNFWASAGEMFSGEDGGGYRYLVPATEEDRVSICRALQLTRQDFYALTGKEAPVTSADTSYEIQYQHLQLELVKLMVWEQGHLRIPKLFCVGPFLNGWDDWTPPDPSVRVIKAESL